jgi:folylpolyglutamate synthase
MCEHNCLAIGFDHQDILGTTIREIAWHKAGIIKPFVPAFTPASQQKEVLDVLQAEACACNAPLFVAEVSDVVRYDDGSHIFRAE